MRITISMHCTLRLDKGVISRRLDRRFVRIKRMTPFQFQEQRDQFRISAILPDSGVFFASIITVSKLSLICYAVRTLLAKNLIPDNTSAILSKVRINYLVFSLTPFSRSLIFSSCLVLSSLEWEPSYPNKDHS